MDPLTLSAVLVASIFPSKNIQSMFSEVEFVLNFSEADFIKFFLSS